MKTLKPKDFIKDVLIDELEGMIDKHPYISFIMIGIGIEFLGKCIDSGLTDWNVSGRSRRDFENAIKRIPSLQKYDAYSATYDTYGSFRCGLAHAVAPKYKITLSSKQEMEHLVESGGRLNFKVEDFYDDFKAACEHVININYPAGDKMNGDFLQVPGTCFNSGTNVPTGRTSSLNSATGGTTNFPSASGSTSP